MDVDTIRKSTHLSWRSNHPASAPYFLEFLPLLTASGGVAKYDASMAFKSYIPADGIDGELSVNEREYLDSLIHHAEDKRCTPVLTGTRSIGRLKAIQKALPVTSIFLHRNLFHQWASYSSQAYSGNTYFLDTVRQIVAFSIHDPTVKMLQDWFGTAAKADDTQLFQLFLLLHLYLYAHAYDAADIVVDVSALAEDVPLRRSLEDRLSSLVSHGIDLSDVRAEFGQSRFGTPDIPGFVDTVEQFTKFLCGSGISEASSAFVNQMTQSALQEWRRHEFYTREFRNTILETVRAMTTKQEEMATQLAGIVAERDRLAQTITAVNAEREDIAARLAAASARHYGP